MGNDAGKADPRCSCDKKIAERKSLGSRCWAGIVGCCHCFASCCGACLSFSYADGGSGYVGRGDRYGYGNAIASGGVDHISHFGHCDFGGFGGGFGDCGGGDCGGGGGGGGGDCGGI